jgi:serine kinase of HPr protein (carbohydrate metabolism regulator)
MHLGLMRRDAVAVHSAAVEMDGQAVLIAGWSESGKTETALALMEAGARFVSDKRTVLRVPW